MGDGQIRTILQETMSNPVYSLFHVSVIVDDAWTFATELKGDIFKIGFGCSLHNLPTDKSRSSKGHLFDMHMFRDSCPNRWTVASDNVHRAVREAHLLDDVAHAQCR